MTDRFEFIDAEYAAYRESGDIHVPSVVKMCRWMEVSRSQCRLAKLVTPPSCPKYQHKSTKIEKIRIVSVATVTETTRISNR